MVIKLTNYNGDIKILKNVKNFKFVGGTLNIWQSNNRQSGYNLMYYEAEFFENF